MTPPAAGEVDAAHEARRALRRARARASRRTDRFVDAYVAGFAVLLLSVWILSFVREASGGTACVGACRSEGTSALLAAAWTLTLGGLLVLAVGAVGPVSSGRAEARWLLGTTADRAVLLRGTLLATSAAGALAGTVAGLVAATAAGGGALALPPLLVGAGVGALAGVLAVLGLLAMQARRSTRDARSHGRAVGGVVGAAAAVTGLALLMVARVVEPTTRLDLGGGGWVAVGLVAVGGVGAVVALGLRASRLLAQLDDVGLAAGREVLDAAVGSVMAMDGQVAEGVSRRRRTARRGRFASRRGRGRGAPALLDADLAAVRRRWRGVVLQLVWIPVVVGVAAGLGDDAALVATGLAAAWAARSGGVGLRTWLGSPGLRRSVTAPHPAVVAALSVSPVLVAAAVSVPVVLLLDAPAWASVHLALAALAATIRSADPVDRDLGALVATPMGALPTGLARAVLHGPDLAVGLAVVLTVWTQPQVLLVAAAAVAWQVSRPRP